MRFELRRAGWTVACSLLVVTACATVDVVPASGEATGGSSTTSSTTSTASTSEGGQDAGVPTGTRFVLALQSDAPASIWANETDPAWQSGHWLTILRDDAALRKARACEYCSCDDCPNCPICGAPCPTATEIREGADVQWSWDGREYAMEPCPTSAQESCLAERTSPPGSYVARFCWGTSYEGTPPCPADVTDVECADVPFVHPDPDGEVRYVVESGG